MKGLYKKLITEFTAAKNDHIYTDCNTKKTVLIDEYEGQYFNIEAFELLNCPFVLVEYDVDYKKSLAEPATLNLTLHLGYEQIKRANNRSVNIDKHLEFHNYTDAIHKIVSSIEIEDYGKANLLAESSLKEPAITKVHTLTYELSYTGRKYKQFEEIETLDTSLEINGKTNHFIGEIET